MLNRFQDKMGTPKEIIVVVGDYSDKGFKGKEPSISKKIRKLFKNRGYETYLIDEYRTSCICSKCHHKTENLVTENGTKIWKLLRCTFCSAIHNRDHNATKNMLTIVNEIKKTKKRPEIFTRK